MQKPWRVFSGLADGCVWHLPHCNICLQSHGKEATLLLSAFRAEQWAHAWVLLQAVLLQETLERLLWRGGPAPYSQVAFSCPVLLFRIYPGSARWKGEGGEWGTCIKELDGRESPESRWPPLKVVSHLSTSKSKIVPGVFLFNCGDKAIALSAIKTSNCVVSYGEGQTDN